MPKEKGFAQVLLILVLLVGIGVAVWGVQYGRTVLKPKASDSYCDQFIKTNGVCGQSTYDTCDISCENGKAYYNCRPSQDIAKRCGVSRVYCLAEDNKCKDLLVELKSVDPAVLTGCAMPKTGEQLIGASWNNQKDTPRYLVNLSSTPDIGVYRACVGFDPNYNKDRVSYIFPQSFPTTNKYTLQVTSSKDVDCKDIINHNKPDYEIAVTNLTCPKEPTFPDRSE